jgi:hypothetical protein
MAFVDGDSLLVGIETEVNGGLFAGGGGSLIAIKLAEEFAEAEVETHGFLECDRNVDRLGPFGLATRAEVINGDRAEGLLGFDFVRHTPLAIEELVEGELEGLQAFQDSISRVRSSIVDRPAT